MILVYGENNSGKSKFSEDLLRRYAGENVYIATMIPFGADGAERIKKHRNMREDLNALTIEDPYLENVNSLFNEPNVLVGSNIIIEDISNLVANIMFNRDESPYSIVEKIEKLKKICKHIILVSIKDLREEKYDGETALYIRTLNDINNILKDISDTVIEMIDGRPKVLKGEL